MFLFIKKKKEREMKVKWRLVGSGEIRQRKRQKKEAKDGGRRSGGVGCVIGWARLCLGCIRHYCQTHFLADLVAHWVRTLTSPPPLWSHT